MTRVLQIITVKPGYEGITMSVMRFVRYMERVECDMVFVGEPPAAIRADFEDMGCRIYVIPGRLRRPVGYMLKLRRIIKAGKYDVVHAHGNSCTLAIELMAAKMAGVKVRAAHSHNTYCKFMLAHNALRPLFDKLYTHAWACGQEAGQWLFPGKDVRIARVSTETGRYAFDQNVRTEYRHELGLDGRFVIGSVANFNPQKNHAFLIDVFYEYHRLDNNSRLVLVGDGPLRGDIEKQIAERGIKDSVLVLGSRDDVPGILQACDAMLLPSIFEGFPGVIIEWQCAGLKALVSDTVTRGTDLTGLVKYLPIDKGADIWVEALLESRKDTARAETSAAAVRAVCDKGYDIAGNARELEEFYINALRQ